MDKAKEGFKAFFNFVGGLSGLLALALVIFKGGALMNTVENNTKRLDRIENQGSASLLAHERMDDERVQDMKQRLVRVEEAFLKLSDMPGEIRVINTKLDALKEQMKK